MRAVEGESEIFLLIVDETYGRNEQTYKVESERYRKTLEREFDAQFSFANVGAGADIPAFLTIIATTSVPLWTVLLGAFFFGKPLNENLDAWKEVGAKIRRFFNRPVILSRNGAAVLAIEAVFVEMGGIPKTLRLLSYRTHHSAFDEELKSLPISNEIDLTPPVLNLGHTLHVYEIEADGVTLRIAVDGKVVRTTQL
jgi:hypothetical protein